MLMIGSMPEAIFIVTSGHTYSLSIMAQQYDTKNIKRDRRLQFGSQQRIIRFCTTHTRDNSCYSLNNARFLYRWRWGFCLHQFSLCLMYLSCLVPIPGNYCSQTVPASITQEI